MFFCFVLIFILSNGKKNFLIKKECCLPGSIWSTIARMFFQNEETAGVGKVLADCFLDSLSIFVSMADCIAEQSSNV